MAIFDLYYNTDINAFINIAIGKSRQNILKFFSINENTKPLYYFSVSFSVKKFFIQFFIVDIFFKNLFLFNKIVIYF